MLDDQTPPRTKPGTPEREYVTRDNQAGPDNSTSQHAHIAPMGDELAESNRSSVESLDK